MAESEQRKLIRFGNSSYVIAIPKGWIDKNKLKKGDSLFVEETSKNELVLSTKLAKESEIKSISLNLDNLDPKDFERDLISAYMNNYSEINIIGKNLKQKYNMIAKSIQEKVGLEISEENDNQITAKDILDLEAISLDKTVRRLDNMLRSMFEEILEGAKSGKIKDWTLKEIENTELGINKFYFLSWKIIRKCQDDPRVLQKFKLDSRGISNIQWVVLHLEYIGDELKRLAKILHKKGIPNQKEFIPVLEKIEEGYISMIGSFYSNDIMSARNLAANKKSKIEMCEKILDTAPAESPEGAESVVEKLKSIYGFVHSISRVIGY